MGFPAAAQGDCASSRTDGLTALGTLEFVESEQAWQSSSTSPIYHGGIPGDEQGPTPEGVAEIVHRLGNIESYWGICSEDLLQIASSFASLPRTTDPRKLYRVAALSLYPAYWEICFETNEALDKWIYVGMQFEGETLVSNTIDT